MGNTQPVAVKPQPKPTTMWDWYTLYQRDPAGKLIIQSFQDITKLKDDPKLAHDFLKKSNKEYDDFYNIPAVRDFMNILGIKKESLAFGKRRRRRKSKKKGKKRRRKSTRKRKRRRSRTKFKKLYS